MCILLVFHHIKMLKRTQNMSFNVHWSLVLVTEKLMSILPPQKRLEISGGGGSQRPKTLRKCMKLNFQRGGGLRKIPSMGEVALTIYMNSSSPYLWPVLYTCINNNFHLYYESTLNFYYILRCKPFARLIKQCLQYRSNVSWQSRLEPRDSILTSRSSSVQHLRVRPAWPIYFWGIIQATSSLFFWTQDSILKPRNFQLETRNSKFLSFKDRVWRLEDGGSRDCQLTFERYCTIF